MRLLPGPFLVVSALLLAACGSDGEKTPSSSAPAPASRSGERVQTSKGEAVLFAGDGKYGVVLAHGAAFDAASWNTQAAAIAGAGTTTLAVEDISPEGIEAAVTYLKEEQGIEDVALMGASAGADGTLALATQKPDLPDQLILLSANSVVDGLGEEPKLFVASKGDPVFDVSVELGKTAAGDENETAELDGSEHAQAIFEGPNGDEVLQRIIDRLAEFSAA